MIPVGYSTQLPACALQHAPCVMKNIALLDLEAVTGGFKFDLIRMFDAGNHAGESTATAGSLVGAGAGALWGGRAQYKGQRFMGMRKGGVPPTAVGTVVGTLGGAAVTGFLGFVFGAASDAIAQYRGEPAVERP
jgi:hypothetical protein